MGIVRQSVRREGYWKEGADSNLPMPMVHTVWKGRAEFLQALARAEAEAQTVAYKGWSTCRICQVHNGNEEYTLRGWQWPSGYAHYIQKHNVRPSLAFQEFITGEEVK